jgi:uncharacterized protein (DUF302 family)
MADYAHTIDVAAPFAQTAAAARRALADQGFGIITEIDVTATFATKLGEQAAEEVGDYLILGACNPALAHTALTADPGIGVFLPCNMVIRSTGPTTTQVQAIDATLMADLSARPALKDIAADADRRLTRALAMLTRELSA